MFQENKCGIHNQGFAMMCLYAMLVLPHETILDEYKEDFDKIEAEMDNWTVPGSTQNYGYTKLYYLRHIRNAIAHNRVEFETGNVIRFNDEVTRKVTKRGDTKEKVRCSFSTEMKLEKLGGFIDRLSEVLMKYIKENAIPKP